jgi:hypothetical protein
VREAPYSPHRPEGSGRTDHDRSVQLDLAPGVGEPTRANVVIGPVVLTDAQGRLHRVQGRGALAQQAHGRGQPDITALAADNGWSGQTGPHFNRRPTGVARRRGGVRCGRRRPAVPGRHSASTTADTEREGLHPHGKTIAGVGPQISVSLTGRYRPTQDPGDFQCLLVSFITQLQCPGPRARVVRSTLGNCQQPVSSITHSTTFRRRYQQDAVD